LFTGEQKEDAVQKYERENAEKAATEEKRKADEKQQKKGERQKKNLSNGRHRY
jgi:hypothetical protein